MFLGTEVEAIFEAFARGEAAAQAQEERLALGTPVLPRLIKHGGDRNRTSPMAFTGSKFEFRMPGAGQSTRLVATVMNTIVADSVAALSRELSARLSRGETLEHAVREVVAGVYRSHGRIVFDGDGYAAEWEREAERRGLLNLRTTPEALPQLVSDSTVRGFAEQGVLSARELEARYDVLVEQYETTITIEAGTAAALARTLLLPATLRQRALIAEAGGPLVEALLTELDEPLGAFVAALRALEAGDDAVPAMATLREHADRLERLVAGDLWPLPKYAEMLFVR